MRAFPLCLTLLMLLPQCGGGGTGGSEPKSAADGARSESGDDSESSADADEEDASASTQDSKARGPNCDDGTCSLCGSGICPSGWYCDENANGGPACSWLTECADKPTCGCITRVLGSACKCREESGGLKVSCN